MAKAKAVAETKSSGGYVTVACNMPTGIILRVDRMVEDEEMTMNGTKTVKRAELIGTIPLNGSATVPGVMPKHPIVAGYAITKNVPADLWNEWLRTHPNDPMIENHVLFAYEKDADMKAALKDHRGMTSGMQRLDMKNGDPRAPKKIKSANDKAADEEADEEAELEDA